jgi:hypothetical protein
MADITTRQVGALNTLEFKMYFGKFYIYTYILVHIMGVLSAYI